MVNISTRNKKQIVMALLVIMGLAGLSMTRDLMNNLFSFDIFGIIDLGTLLGIFALVSFYWLWRREV